MHYIHTDRQTYIQFITSPYHSIPFHTFHTIHYHSIPFHFVALHTITYHFITYHYSTYRYITVHSIVMHCIALHTIPYHNVCMYTCRIHYMTNLCIHTYHTSYIRTSKVSKHLQWTHLYNSIFLSSPFVDSVAVANHAEVQPGNPSSSWVSR